MKIVPALLAAALLSLASAEGATLRLDMLSEPGDRIGQGKTWSLFYDTQQGSEVHGRIQTPLVGGRPAEIWITGLESVSVPASVSTLAEMFFGTSALGIPIQPGIYENAERAAFASSGHPGLDISFQGHGQGTVYGSFTVSEVTFNAAGIVLETFAAAFVQHSEGAAPALRGTVHYHLNPVPEPSALTLYALACTALLLMRRKWRFLTVWVANRTHPVPKEQLSLRSSLFFLAGALAGGIFVHRIGEPAWLIFI